MHPAGCKRRPSKTNGRAGALPFDRVTGSPGLAVGAFVPLPPAVSTVGSWPFQRSISALRLLQELGLTLP